MNTLGKQLKCAARECNRLARFEPEIRFSGAIMETRESVSTQWKKLGIPVCKGCRFKMKLADILSPAMWTEVCESMKKQKITVFFEKTKMRFSRI